MILQNIIFHLFSYPATLICSILAVFFSFIDRTGNASYRVGICWSKFILTIAGVRLNIKSMPPLDPKSSYIFLSNHQSQMDIPILMYTLRAHKARFVAKESLFRIPIFGSALKSIRSVAIDRGNRRQAMKSLEEAVEQTNRGESMLVFPEGTRCSDFGEFKIGGIILALKTGKPIVPIVLNGSAEILPRNSLIIHPGQVIIEALSPIDAAQLYTMKDREKLKDDLWKKMNAVFQENKKWQRHINP